jgi:tetratricopeptide (TPR) repeat protein
VSEDLREEREFLLRSIADLDAELAAGDIDEEDHRALRDEYTARAADVLRRLEDTSSTPARPPAAVGPSRRRTRRVRAAAAVLLLAVVSGGAGYAVALSSGERLATDEATGDITEGSTDRITKAQVLVSEGRSLDAVKVFDELLADDPDNPVALAQRGWLISRVDASLVDKGLSEVDRAIEVEPTYADAYFFRGMILLRSKGDPAAAGEAFRKGLEMGPAPEVKAALEAGRAQAEAAASATP